MEHLEPCPAAADDEEEVPVDGAEVPQDIWYLARVAVMAASWDLHIYRPQILWYEGTKTLGQSFRGYSGEIWLNVSIEGCELLRVVAHHVGHCAGYTEEQAQAYERKFLDEVLRW